MITDIILLIGVIISVAAVLLMMYVLMEHYGEVTHDPPH